MLMKECIKFFQPKIKEQGHLRFWYIKHSKKFYFKLSCTNLLFTDLWFQLRYIFVHLLPKLGIPVEDKVLVDIGSRLGGVLYAAALFWSVFLFGGSRNLSLSKIGYLSLDIALKTDCVPRDSFVSFWHLILGNVKIWKRKESLLTMRSI